MESWVIFVVVGLRFLLKFWFMWRFILILVRMIIWRRGFWSKLILKYGYCRWFWVYIYEMLGVGRGFV